jgi:serine/threonine-protein kinase
MSAGAATARRLAAAEALGKIGGGQYWSLPHGEPEWALVPEGEFTMGDGDQAQRLAVAGFSISRAPITNAQYQLFLHSTEHELPEGWAGRRAPKGRESHPVVNVSWHDAIAYCRWLGAAVGKSISLPSEAEWEKAARGAQDARAYPWGDVFDAARCNVEHQFGDTTPVGVFSGGASPYGCVDMAGNVWEWTRTPRGKDFPYSRDETARENIEAGEDVLRVVRGGSWFTDLNAARCAYCYWLRPERRSANIGFRVVWRSALAQSL